MQWWNDVSEWLASEEGWRVLSTAVIPFVAIVIAGAIAALIGRAASRRVIAFTERERRTATVAALIAAARRASKWNTLSLPEQEHTDHLIHEAETRIRLLPLSGSGMVADWAAHEIEDMKRNSVSFSFQAEQSLIEFRNRLVAWQAKPSRAKKLFKADLDTWAFENPVEDDLVARQQEWARQQLHADTPAPAATDTATAAFATPAPAANTVPSAGTESPVGVTSSSGTTPSAGAAPQPVAPRESTRSATESAQIPSWEDPARTVPSTPTNAAFPTLADTHAESSGDSGETADEASATASDEPTSTGENPSIVVQDDVPGPVSAGTVRQRINPEDRDY